MRADERSVTLEVGGTETALNLSAVSTISFENSHALAGLIPTEGQAIVYFFTESFAREAIRVSLPIYHNERQIAEIPSARVFALRVAPGKHTFRSNEASAAPVEIEARANQVYFIRVTLREGVNRMRGLLAQADPILSANMIRRLRPLSRDDIHNNAPVIIPPDLRQRN